MSVRKERSGAAVVVTLDRPEVLNAINTAMLDELDAALDELEASDAALLVLTGSGRAFCSGSDLGGTERHEGDTRTFAEQRIRRMHALALRLIGLRQPSVAALNGLAYGGGLELALACTFRIAAPGAKLCLPEIRHNLMPSYGGTQLLPRLIGVPRALELMLTGESIDAARALELGLVTLVDADPVAAALRLVERLPNGAGLAQRMIRRSVAMGLNRELGAALDLERELATENAASAEARAGAARFAERKRR